MCKVMYSKPVISITFVKYYRRWQYAAAAATAAAAQQEIST